MPKYHHRSTFGPGIVRPLDREQRAVWRARLEMARRAGRITDAQSRVGEYLIRLLGQSGRLDPSHGYLAELSCESISTVKRALARLAALGLVSWQRRLIRTKSWRVEQTSNQYQLWVAAGWVLPTDAQTEREVPKKILFLRSRVQTDAEIDAEGFQNRDRQLAIFAQWLKEEAAAKGSNRSGSGMKSKQAGI